MKWKNLLALTALPLVFAGQATAMTAVQNGSNLRVTFGTADDVLYLHDNPFGECAEGESSVYVQAYIGGDLGESTEHCGVNNIRVAGLSGNNALVMGSPAFGVGLTIPGQLDIRGGAGNDIVAFHSDTSVGSLTITLRGGNNRVIGANNGTFAPPGGFTSVTSGSVSVNTSLDIDTNNGNDRVNFRALTVGGTADINVGGGDDKANIYGGGGPNSFNKLFMRLGSGDNQGSIRNTTCHLCQVFGGGGSDDIFLKNVSAGIDVDVIAGGGDDTVELKNVNSGTDVNANGGAGEDCLIDDGSATTVVNFEPCSS